MNRFCFYTVLYTLKIMEVAISIKRANHKMYRLKRSDGTIIYLDSNIKKQKKIIDFLEGKDLK